MSGYFHERWPWRRDPEGRTLLELWPRRVRWAIGGVLVAVALGAFAIRAVGHDPDRWHVDPFAAERSARPNDALFATAGLAAAPADREVGPYDLTPAALVERLAEVALAEPRTEVVAGSAEATHLTLVQRSAVFGFPDYVSIRAAAVGGGAGVALWSRSRWGYSDMGVNRTRLERWTGALDVTAAPASGGSR